MMPAETPTTVRAGRSVGAAQRTGAAGAISRAWSRRVAMAPVAAMLATLSIASVVVGVVTPPFAVTGATAAAAAAPAPALLRPPA